MVLCRGDSQDRARNRQGSAPAFGPVPAERDIAVTRGAAKRRRRRIAPAVGQPETEAQRPAVHCPSPVLKKQDSSGETAIDLILQKKSDRRRPRRPLRPRSTRCPWAKTRSGGSSMISGSDLVAPGPSVQDRAYKQRYSHALLSFAESRTGKIC